MGAEEGGGENEPAAARVARTGPVEHHLAPVCGVDLKGETPRTAASRESSSASPRSAELVQEGAQAWSGQVVGRLVEVEGVDGLVERLRCVHAVELPLDAVRWQGYQVAGIGEFDPAGHSGRSSPAQRQRRGLEAVEQGMGGASGKPRVTSSSTSSWGWAHRAS